MKGRVQERTEEEIKRGRREHEFTQAKVSICENYKMDKNSPPNGMCYVRGEGTKKKKRQENERWIVGQRKPQLKCSFAFIFFSLAQLRNKSH